MILNVYKPPGITSHDAVNAVRKITRERRVGHGGTLDPFAEGVLIVGVGRESTKKLGETLKNSEKEYVALIELGKTSTTGDPEGVITETSTAENLANLNLNRIEKTFDLFRGEIEQTPPPYSAVKIKGVPAYKLARRGERPVLKPRKAQIKKLEIMEYKLPFLKIKVVCGSGVYIRVLAEDLGKNLATGGYLKKLTRTRVGNYRIEESLKIEDIPGGASYGRT